MKSNFKFLLLITALVLALSTGISALAGSEKTPLTRAGEAYADWAASSDEARSDVIAVYGDYEITRARLDYEMAIADSYSGEEHASRLEERSVAMAIITNIIITEEAEALGLGATQDEIEDMVEMTKAAYELPSGKALMDGYFESMGISADEYFELVREQAPGMIARQKLKNSVATAYREEHGLEFGEQREAVQKAVQDYIDGLVSEHEDEIIFYI